MNKRNKLILICGIVTLVIIAFVVAATLSQSDSNAKTSSATLAESSSVSETTMEPETTTINEVESTTVAEFPTSYTKKEYKELINFEAEFPYLIYVNRAKNWVTIFAMDHLGRYSVPYKIFRCSVGLNIEDTPTGVYTISDKYEWRLMVDGSYGRYAMRINGPIMLHSVPYYSTNKDDLEVEEYNKLGSPASLGCIRLNVKNVKWIYKNCAPGTTVIVYDSENEIAPLEITDTTKAVSKGKKAGWDPTDPDKNNPWNN